MAIAARVSSIAVRKNDVRSSGLKRFGEIVFARSLENRTLQSNMSFMNKIFRTSQLTPYEADYAQWCAEQGALLRQGRLVDLDRANLAEEIESLGRSDKREIESRLKVLLVYLIKYRFQPEGRSGSWRATIREQRVRIGKVLRESPSLQGYPAEALAEEYALAMPEAAEEAKLADGLVPNTCPFTIGQILGPDFLPE